MKEQRTERLNLRVKPDIKIRVEAEAHKRGQPLAVWFERLVEAVVHEIEDAENIR